MSFSFILVTDFRKLFAETENAGSSPYFFSLFYKTKNSFVDIGSESGITNRPSYVYFFSQYAMNERTEFIFVVCFF